jgi:hypothetical protein
MSEREVLRRVWLKPYRAGMGPKFYLQTWDTGRTDGMGKTIIGYELALYPNARGGKGRVSLFTGEDFACSPLHAIDSDECVRGLLTFLTLRPGDTDASYFEGYSEAQRDYCASHAEALAGEVLARFGE